MNMSMVSEVTCINNLFLIGERERANMMLQWARFFSIIYITKYGSTLYIGMGEVFQHYAHTFEKSNLNFHFQCEFSSVAAEL